MGFGEAFRRSFTDAGRLCLALPWIFLALVAVEAVQHYGEWRVGSYDSLSAFQRHANDALRMGPGFVKVFLSFAVLYPVARWAASGRQVVSAFQVDGTAIRRFAVVMGVYALTVLVQFNGVHWLQAAGLNQKDAIWVFLDFMLVTFPLGFVLLPWTVGSTLGGVWVSPAQSVRLSFGSLLWSLGLLLATNLPLMILHHVLGYAAIGKPLAALVPMLAVDSVVAGVLILVLNLSMVLSAQRMLEHHGQTLTCGDGSFV